MRFIRVLVLLLLTVPVCLIQRNTNLIDNQFSRIGIYCRQSFVKIGSSARSSVQCASYCLSFFTPYCKAFIWNKIYKKCSLIDKITKIEVAVGVYVPVQSELDIYAAFKDGQYHSLNSASCIFLRFSLFSISMRKLFYISKENFLPISYCGPRNRAIMSDDITYTVLPTLGGTILSAVIPL